MYQDRHKPRRQNCFSVDKMYCQEDAINSDLETDEGTYFQGSCGTRGTRGSTNISIVTVHWQVIKEEILACRRRANNPSKHVLVLQDDL